MPPTPSTPGSDTVPTTDGTSQGDTGPVSGTVVGMADDADGSTPGSTSPHDAAWFEALVRQHATAVHRFMVRRAGRDEAEDLAADVLTVACRRF